MAASLPEWREPEQVLDLARFAVAERDGAQRAEIEALTASLSGRERIEFFDMPLLRLLLRDPLPRGRRAPDPVARARLRGRLHRRARPLPKRGDGLMDGGGARPPRRGLCRRQEGAGHRRARPARRGRLHGLLRRLHRRERAPGEGDPRRDTPGDEGRPRPASQPRRGARGVPVGAHGLPRRGRPRLHARHARLLPPRAAVGRGALARVRQHTPSTPVRRSLEHRGARTAPRGVLGRGKVLPLHPSLRPGQWPSVAHPIPRRTYGRMYSPPAGVGVATTRGSAGAFGGPSGVGRRGSRRATRPTPQARDDRKATYIAITKATAAAHSQLGGVVLALALQDLLVGDERPGELRLGRDLGRRDRGVARQVDRDRHHLAGPVDAKQRLPAAVDRYRLGRAEHAVAHLSQLGDPQAVLALPRGDVGPAGVVGERGRVEPNGGIGLTTGSAGGAPSLPGTGVIVTVALVPKGTVVDRPQTIRAAVTAREEAKMPRARPGAEALRAARARAGRRPARR